MQHPTLPYPAVLPSSHVPAPSRGGARRRGTTLAAASLFLFTSVAWLAAPAPSARAAGDYRDAGQPGQTIELAKNTVTGKFTVFDFSSEYCGPCPGMGAALKAFAAKAPDKYAVRKIDINRPGAQGIDWQSPVAKQFKLESIPHLKVYDPSGRLVAEGDAAREWLSKEAKKVGLM